MLSACSRVQFASVPPLLCQTLAVLPRCHLGVAAQARSVSPTSRQGMASTPVLIQRMQPLAVRVTLACWEVPGREV
jgi:hypothetical protein